MIPVVQDEGEHGFTKPVLVLSHMFPNPNNHNAGIFVFEQVQALRKLGVRVLVVSPSPWPPPLFDFLPRVRKFRAVPKQNEIGGYPVEHPRVLTFPGGRLFFLEGLIYYLGCRKLVKRLVNENEVALIHAHTILPDGLAAVLLGREFNLPVLCTLHGSDIRVYPYRDRMTMWLTRWALKRVNRLVAVSSDLKSKVLSLSGVLDVSVNHNAADPRAFRSISKSEARQELGLIPKKKMLLFVGHLRPVKGVEFLLEAVSQLGRDDLELCLVGDGESKSLLTSIVDQLGIADICHFVGRRPHDEIPLWLAAADCLVLPSLSEGLPTILVEAMFCRTPVVATNVGGVPEIVHDRHTGLLVKPKDSGALAQAIAEVLTDRDLGPALVDNAEMEVRGRLTWEANARATIAGYKDMLLDRTCSARTAKGAHKFSSTD